jgi:urea-proton symporter
MNNENAILDATTGWIMLVVLGLVWIALGVYWGRKAKNMEGFMLAGRNVGLALGAATAMATWITSNTTMLAPQFALELGIWGMLAYSTASFGLLLFAPLAKRVRAVMPEGYTSGDFIRLRYGKGAWYFFLGISIFYSFTWLISMGMAGGILLNALAGISYQVGMTVILLVCVIYTLFGGLFAVIGTDYIQSLIILVGIVVVGFGVIEISEVSTVHQNVMENQPMLLNALLPASIMAIFNNLLFGIGEIFHSNVWWSRAFAMRKGIGKKAYILAGIFWLPVPVAAGFIALASGALGINVTSPDMVGPMVAASVLGEIGAVVVFAVFFASLASSIDSLLAATSDLITEDIYRKLINPKADPVLLRKVSARIIIGLGVVAWLVCLPRIGTLADVLFFAGPMVGSTIWPIATGLFWKRASAQGALWGMVMGTFTGLIAYFQLGWYTASLTGAAVSMVITVVSAYLKPDHFDWQQLNEKHAIGEMKA